MSGTEVALIAVLNAVIVGLGLVVRANRRRGADELRIRLLEALAAAARRGVPLGPLVERASTERRGRLRHSLERLAEDVENGVPLADALAACRALALPGAVAASIRAAEGTPALADALAAAARDETAARARRHRTWGEAAYPAVVLALLVFVSFPGMNMLARCAEVAASYDLPDPRSWWVRVLGDVRIGPGPVAWVLGVVIVAYLVHRCRGMFGGAPRLLPTWSLFGEVPPFRGPSRLAGAAAFLDALAAQTRAGRPLDDAARAASAASRNLAVRRGARRMADGVERGDLVLDVWSCVPLPPSIVPRAGAASGLRGAQAADAFERLAAECRGRLEGAVEARLVWIAPAGLALAGVFVGTLAYSVFDLEMSVLRTQVPVW